MLRESLVKRDSVDAALRLGYKERNSQRAGSRIRVKNPASSFVRLVDGAAATSWAPNDLHR